MVMVKAAAKLAVQGAVKVAALAVKVWVVQAVVILEVGKAWAPAWVVALGCPDQNSLNINQIPVDSAAAIVRSAILIDSPRRQVLTPASTGSHKDTVHHVPVDVSKAEIAPLIFVGQFLVV